MNLPHLPCSFESFPTRLEKVTSAKAVLEAVEPFKAYEAKLRQIYAQDQTHPATLQNHLVPLYHEGVAQLTVKAREISTESENEKSRFLLPLSTEHRRKHGSVATTTTMRDFKRNFSIFSEASLADLNWNNVVAAGSSVVTALLPVDAPHNESKRTLRSYYHEVIAPASDVDLFIYGLNEAQALDKMNQIEAQIRDSILSETTVVRTKNAVTIVSEYPTRHVQIVLRLYKSISEILTGFDVDCACVAYDGKQVWAAPRALAAFATQTNSIDLTRRSPSYENRLSKYSHRGFEVFWPLIDRSRIDPTIYERAFNRVRGLARLLVLEKLPHPQDRDEYLVKRRAERGRPDLPWNARFRHQLPGNIKDTQPDDVAEWVEEDDVSSYHTFTIPWGPRYSTKKIERLLYQQDLLKNAEWNRPKDRQTKLHRHPAFFGRMEDVIQDCCGYCPKPTTDEDLLAWEEESKIFVSGDIKFLTDDPGRQEIGSFHPLTDEDWTEMAYIGNTTRLCQAIVDKDLEGVTDWFSDENTDVDRRDHTGRTPLQLAVICSTPEIVQCLIDHGARIVARLYNGLTALHLAAWRGSPEMVKALLDKSAENEAEKDANEEKRKKERRQVAGLATASDEDVEMTQPEENADEEDSDDNDLMEDVSDDDSEDRMTGSFVKIEDAKEPDVEAGDKNDPDVYNIDVVAWDSPCSALHLAIMAGYQNVIQLLVEEYGADVMLPVKLMTTHGTREPRAAILTLLLPLDLPSRKANETVKQLLGLGASPVQADMDQRTSLHYIVGLAKTEILKAFGDTSPEATSKAINHLIVNITWRDATVDCPLLSAIRSGSPETVREVLSMGAKPVIEFDDYVNAYKAARGARDYDADEMKNVYLKSVTQPIIEAARQEGMLEIVAELLTGGADVNTLSANSWGLVQSPQHRYNTEDVSLLDLVKHRRERLMQFAKEPIAKETDPPKRAETLESDDYYLEGLDRDTYQHWSASNDLVRARFVQRGRAKKFQHDFDSAKPSTPEKGLREKKQAAADLANSFENLERSLIEKGAKGFYELYPKLKIDDSGNNARSTNNNKDLYEGEQLAYRTRFGFRGSGVTPSKQARFIQLFEAAFTGDTDKVKELCLSNDDSVSALQISTQDDNGFDPFSIAILRGHQELAKIVLDIAAAQYEDKKDTKHTQYSLQPYNSEDDEVTSNAGSITSDDPPRFYARLVDDNFTIDDIGALAKSVKSDVRPSNMLGRACELWRAMNMEREEALQQCRVAQAFDPEPYIYYRTREKPWAQFDQCVTNESSRSRFTMWTYAVVTNNVSLLKFLLESEVKCSTVEPDELLKSLDARNAELTHAMNLGYLEIVDTLLRYRGALLPLHHLAKKSGSVVEEVPKFYQGLSVYGRKRKEWVRQNREAYVDKSEAGSPLLNAIMEGKLDLVDYFMSDTPTRRYEEFCSRFNKDQRIRALAESKGGISGSLKAWMATRTNLALHIAVMSWPAGANHRLRYLLGKVPAEYLEVRSTEGYTPLHLALELGNLPAFEALLAAGANQRTRDVKGHNLLHTVYRQANHMQIALFSRKISMLDQKIIADMLLERCSGTEPGSLTPLSLHLRSSPYQGEKGLELLDTMLKISKCQDLTTMDGAGDYPLHFEVRNNNIVRAEYLAKRRPELLFRENATGMTPIEVAQTTYFQSRIQAQSIKQHSDNDSIIDKPARDFVEKDDNHGATPKNTVDDNDDLPLSHPMYATLLRVARVHPQPRSLVSVLDANEVARRLAGQQRRKNAENRRREAQGLKSRWNRYYSRNGENELDADKEGEQRKEDEVSRWFGTGQARMTKVPFCVHGDDTMEAVEAGLAKWREFAEGRIQSLRCCEKADHMDPWVRREHKKMGIEIEMC